MPEQWVLQLSGTVREQQCGCATREEEPGARVTIGQRPYSPVPQYLREMSLTDPVTVAAFSQEPRLLDKYMVSGRAWDEARQLGP